MKRILFIHKNYPAQFGALGHWLAGQGWDVTFATQREDAKSDTVRIVKFSDHRKNTDGIHHYVAGMERAVITGQGFVRLAVALKNQGYEPDIVVAHSGWGAGAFAKDVWPTSRYVPYVEWWYQFPALDITPHDNLGDPLDVAARTRVRNAPSWLDFTGADAVIAPTKYQKSTFPKKMQSQITVLPDGMDTDLHSPGPRSPELMKELGIPEDAQIITYIARGMEPARGFPEMMRAVTALQADRPNFHAIIIGEDRVAYGSKAKAESWKDKMLAELTPDLQRLHFTGLVSRRRMIEVLRAGDAHLYLSTPFVLSWSVLDAMACGALIVANDSAPVREFITNGKSGLLVDMYDPDALQARIAKALDGGASLKKIRQTARKRMVDTMDAGKVAYPKKVAFFETLVGEKNAPKRKAAKRKT